MIEKAARKYQMDVRKKQAGAEIGPELGRVITISREFGAGGRQVSLILGRMLEWQLWDKEIMEVLASEAGDHVQDDMFEALDEKVQGEIEALLASLLGQTEKHTYFFLLPRAIYTIAQDDGIVLGRGAHLLLPKALKVHLTASFENRVQNLVGLYEIDEKEAEREVVKTEKDREGFMKELRKRVSLPQLPQGAPQFDLEINTDHLSFYDVAQIILVAMSKRFKMEVPLH